ncbi:MAG: hypothetical protein AB7L90_10195 [Hyphomicrobiaceae bacterium]
MPLTIVAVLIAAIGGSDGAARPHVELAQSTNPALSPPARFGRSYAAPDQTNPGTSSGPLLKTPGFTPALPSTPGVSREPRNRPTQPYPTASDCAAGHRSGSGITRREFNRLCGQGS